MSTDISAPPCPTTTDPRRLGLALAVVGNLLERQGWTPEQVNQAIARARAQQEAYAAKYPLADAELPLSDQMAADERTLGAAIRERTARQYATQ